MSIPKVVIVGGSYSGVTVATKLDQKMKDSIHITLIEKRDHFFHTVGSVRAVAVEDYSENLFIPYDNIFKHKNRVVKQAEVVQVHQDKVVLSNGEVVPFDYLVLATGSQNVAPFKMNVDTKEEGLELFKQIQSAVKKASSAIVVGGGAVGIEVAGEIKTTFPHIKVQLITSQDILAPPCKSSPKQIAKLKNQMKELGIELITATRVKTKLPAYSLNPMQIETENGKFYSADIVIKSTGNSYRTDFIEPLISKLNKDKLFNYQKRLNVKASTQLHDSIPNVFVVGDICTLQPDGGIYAGTLQAEVAANNIELLIKQGSQVKLQQFKEFTSAVSVVSLGRYSGVSLFPFGTFGGFVTRTIKSKGMFVSKYWSILNQSFNGRL